MPNIIPFVVVAMQELEFIPWGDLRTILAASSFVVIVWMHIRTDGKSSPLAALAFVVCGPVLTVLISIPYALREAALGEQGIFGHGPGAEVTLNFAVYMVDIGLLAAAVTALIVAYVNRDYV